MAYEQEVATASAQYGVDPNLIQAVIQQESSGNANATSGAGAMGLMQLMPSTFNSLGVGSNAYDPQTNINAGTKYLAQLLSQSGGDVETALASYYAGSGNVAKYGKEKYSTYYNGVLSKYQSTSTPGDAITGALTGGVLSSNGDVLSGALTGGLLANDGEMAKTLGANVLKVLSVVGLIIIAVIFICIAVLDNKPIDGVTQKVVKAVM